MTKLQDQPVTITTDNTTTQSLSTTSTLMPTSLQKSGKRILDDPHARNERTFNHKTNHYSQSVTPQNFKIWDVIKIH
jgi:hypothetical protein